MSLQPIVITALSGGASAVFVVASPRKHVPSGWGVVIKRHPRLPARLCRTSAGGSPMGDNGGAGRCGYDSLVHRMAGNLISTHPPALGKRRTHGGSASELWVPLRYRRPGALPGPAVTTSPAATRPAPSARVACSDSMVMLEREGVGGDFRFRLLKVHPAVIIGPSQGVAIGVVWQHCRPRAGAESS